MWHERYDIKRAIEEQIDLVDEYLSGIDETLDELRSDTIRDSVSLRLTEVFPKKPPAKLDLFSALCRPNK